MRTTLNVDPKLLSEVTKATGEKTPSKAVNKVLSEWLRRRKVDELRKMLGTMELDDNLQELKELELKELPQ
jgi:hypothetical protein